MTVDAAFGLTRAGWQAVEAGDWHRAHRDFAQALRLSPSDPVALTGVGAAYQGQGQLREAVLSCDAAIRAAPGFAPAWLQRGYVLAAGGSTAGAKASFARAIELDGANGPAMASLAGLEGRDGNADKARMLAERALTIDPGNAIATCALAALEIEQGAASSALSRLLPLSVRDDPPSEQRATMFGLLGDANDRLGRIDDAFAAYEHANAAFLAAHAASIIGRADTQTDFIAGISSEVCRHGATLGPLPARSSAPFANHVFLLGYPRSGTTLVENILASSPGVVALEERPTLREADELFLAPGGIARLAELDEGAAEQLRTAYWNRVAAATSRAPGTTFVDMDPLKGIRLAVIARLFPEARVLVMRRDPRDVVWSCFRTVFALTPASIEFATLAGAARHYDALMTLTDLCLSRLDLHAHDVRYDALVNDFDTTTKALCAFVGIEWSEGLRTFDKTARARGVATASATQVRRGLYDGTRQWERYARHLAPVLPILAPWVARFGFAP